MKLPFASLGFVLALEGLALACSPALCNPSSFAPSDGTVPLGAPFVWTRSMTYAPDLGEDGLTLLGPDGQEQPYTVEPLADGVVLVHLAAGAPTGSYQFALVDGCDAASQRSGSFTVGPAVAAPTSAGAVQVAASEVRDDVSVSTVSGSCTNVIRAAVAKLTLEPTDELAAWLPVATITTRVDGTVWAASRLGGQPTTPSGLSGVRPWNQVHARCVRETNSPDDDGLTLGKHTGELVVQVAGADPLPPVPFELELRCDDVTPADAGATTDGGALGGDEGSGCGCALGARRESGRRTPAALALAAFALLSLLGWRRRARR